MGRKHFAWAAVAVIAALLASQVVAAPPTDPSAKPPKLQQKSVTVFPVIITPGKDMGPDLRKRVAEVVGMLLERAEMKEVQLADAEFIPEKDVSVQQVAGAFAQWVSSRSLQTPYALFSEIRGEPKTGVDAIRIVVADTKGNVVLAEETVREAFGSSGPVVPTDPMTCAVFIAGRLREPWGLADPMRQDAPDGQLQQNWRKKSGLPTDDETKAMKARESVLGRQAAQSSLQVCPACVGGKPAPETAAKLTALLADAGFASVKALDKGPELRVEGSPNEQEVLWRTARKARDYFRAHPPASQYVLVADFGMGRNEEGPQVGAVHWIVCNQRGEWVMVDFQNSHHADFQQVEPKSVEDCLELVKVRLKKRLAAANELPASTPPEEP